MYSESLRQPSQSSFTDSDQQSLVMNAYPSGSPTTSIYTPWTEAEVLSHLTTGWGSDAITELKLEYLYRPEPEVSGE